MNEMIERVARTLCQTSGRAEDDVSGGPHPMGMWLDEGEHFWTGYAEAARAAIEAMRQPTQAMRDPGVVCFYEWSGDVNDGAVDVWQTMIDAALQEPGEER